MSQPRKVPLKAQCAAGHEIISVALTKGHVMNEYKDAANGLLKTLDWLMKNEEAVRLAIKITQAPDVHLALETVFDAREEFPGAQLIVRTVEED